MISDLPEGELFGVWGDNQSRIAWISSLKDESGVSGMRGAMSSGRRKCKIHCDQPSRLTAWLKILSPMRGAPKVTQNGCAWLTLPCLVHFSRNHIAARVASEPPDEWPVNIIRFSSATALDICISREEVSYPSARLREKQRNRTFIYISINISRQPKWILYFDIKVITGIRTGNCPNERGKGTWIATQSIVRSNTISVIMKNFINPNTWQTGEKWQCNETTLLSH